MNMHENGGILNFSYVPRTSQCTTAYALRTPTNSKVGKLLLGDCGSNAEAKIKGNLKQSHVIVVPARDGFHHLEKLFNVALWWLESRHVMVQRAVKECSR